MHNTHMKRAGMAVFLFFFAKGMVWIALAAGGLLLATN